MLMVDGEQHKKMWLFETVLNSKTAEKSIHLEIKLSHREPSMQNTKQINTPAVAVY